MMKMSPGARLGIAVAIAGEVFSIPIKKRDWNKVTLKIKYDRNISLMLCYDSYR